MTTRKTIAVNTLREWANTYLAAPDSFHRTETRAECRAQRLGVASLLETALHAAGQYKGFRYLDTELAEPGVLREDYDDTRRQYL